jgi:hypothetical protein
MAVWGAGGSRGRGRSGRFSARCRHGPTRRPDSTARCRGCRRLGSSRRVRPLPSSLARLPELSCHLTAAQHPAPSTQSPLLNLLAILSPLSAMSGDPEPAVYAAPTTKPPYRRAIQITEEMRQHCHIYLDEQLCTLPTNV